jgi:hypothetical protein
MYAVFRDAQSHCCLVVFDDDLTVQYIALTEEGGELKVDLFKVDASAFHREFKKLEEYPVKRAAQHFIKPLTSAIVVTSAAQRHLDHIMENKMSTTETNTKASTSKTVTKTKPDLKASPKPTPKVDTTKPRKAAASHDAGQSNVTAANKASVKTTTKAAHAPVVAPAKFKKPTAKQLADGKKKIEREKAAAKADAAKAKQAEKDEAAAAKAAAAGKAPPKVVKAAKVAKKAAKKAAAKKKPTPAKKVAKLVRNPKHSPPAKKGKAAKGEKKAGRPGAFTEDMHITVLVKDNPKREGTGAHEIFELLRKSKTVGEFYKKGGASSNLRWNIDHEYIKVK